MARNEPLTVVITADVHLDAGRVSHINPATGREVAWENAQRCLEFCTQLAVERKAAAFVVAGDLFLNGHPGPEAQGMVQEALKPALEAGVPVILLPGNHEYLGLPPLHRHVLHSFETLVADEGHPGCLVVDRPSVIGPFGGDPGVNIAVMPWPTRRLVTDWQGEAVEPTRLRQVTQAWLNASIGKLDAEIRERKGFSLLVGHLSVAEARLRGSEANIGQLTGDPVVSVETLAGTDFGVAVLGHIHKHQRIEAKQKRTAVYYTGSPDRVDFSEESMTPMATVVHFGVSQDDGSIDSPRGSRVEEVEIPYARRLVTVHVQDEKKLEELSSLDLGPTDAVRVIHSGDKSEESAIETIRNQHLKAGAIVEVTARREAAQRESFVPTSHITTLEEALDAWARKKGVGQDHMHELLTLAREIEQDGDGNVA